jgi:hypothetical protein
MSQIRSYESPLDLLQAGRDELIEGTGPAHIVPNVDPHNEHLEPTDPDQSLHRHSPQRELQSQSAVLSHAGE